MAPKRANTRTNTVNKRSNDIPQRHQNYPSQITRSSRYNSRTTSSTHPETKTRTDSSKRHRETPTIDPLPSDTSSVSSIAATPRSSEQAFLASGSYTVPASKRRRTEFEGVSSPSLSSHYIGAAPDPRNIESTYTSNQTLQVADPQQSRSTSDFHNRRKTGSCISKRRGKGNVGGSSSEYALIVDQNQQGDMPADLGEQSRKSPVPKINTRSGSKSREGLFAAGTSGDKGVSASSNWFRNFTCFSNESEEEQGALDLSAPSQNALEMPSGPSSSAAGSSGQRLTPSASSGYSAIPVPKLRSHSKAEVGHDSNSGSHSNSSRTGGGRSSGYGRNAAPFTFASSGAQMQQSQGWTPSQEMQQLHQQMQQHHHQGSGVNYRIMQLRMSLGDVNTQLILLQEINQALLMNSDESLAGLAVGDLVSALIDLLDPEKSVLPDEDMVELKNLACNILAHLMDAVPKAADVVVAAVPLLLGTMASSFVGDILERIINVLEQVSRRNGRQILLYGGVSAVLGYYDFVTVAQHRTILAMVANCFCELRSEDFATHIQGCLASLSERLAPGATAESRCLERVCLCFARLVHAFRSEPPKLRQIASYGLAENLKHLLGASPPIVTSMKDIAYVLATLCTRCPDLGIELTKLGYAETIYSLVTDQEPPRLSCVTPVWSVKGGPRCTSLRSSIARSLEAWGTDNVCAIIHLISSMLPPIQESNITTCPPPVDPAIQTRSTSNSTKGVDPRTALCEGQCKAFESLVVEAKTKKAEDVAVDVNSENLTFVRTVNTFLPMLLDLYTELNAIGPRLKCIDAIQRIASNASPFVLSWVVSPRSVSAMVADMLGNPEFGLIAAGLQLANLFISRVPQVFAVYFRKEGVLFHLKRLTTLAAENAPRETNSANANGVPSGRVQRQSGQTDFPTIGAETGSGSKTSPSAEISYDLRRHHYAEFVSPSVSQLRLRNQRGNSKPALELSALVSGNLSEMQNFDEEATSSSSDASSTSTLDMDEPSQVVPSFSPPAAFSVPTSDYHDNNLRAWIASRCMELCDRIQALTATARPETLASKAAASGASSDAVGKKAPRRHPSTAPTPSLAAALGPVPRDLVPELEALSAALQSPDDPVAWADALTRLASLLKHTSSCDNETPSPFEFQQSGLLNALYGFLSHKSERRLRFFLFLTIFVGSKITDNISLKSIVERPKVLAHARSALATLKQKPNERSISNGVFPMLVNCLLDCLHQQDHFQVLTNPASLVNPEACAEELMMAPVNRNRSGMLSAPQSVPHQRRPGASGSNSGAPSGRKSGGSSSQQQQHEQSTMPDEQQQRVRAGPRRFANLTPGYLKLEIVKMKDEAGGCAAAASTSTSSSKQSGTEVEPSAKGTFWENCPASLHLHVNSLITASSLQRLFVQRAFISSVMLPGSEEAGSFSGVVRPHCRTRGGGGNESGAHEELPLPPSASSSSSSSLSSTIAQHIMNRRHRNSHRGNRGGEAESPNPSTGHLDHQYASSPPKAKDSSRVRSMSFLAAFGMLQFPSSSSNAGAMASPGISSLTGPSDLAAAFGTINSLASSSAADALPSPGATVPPHSHGRKSKDRLPSITASVTASSSSASHYPQQHSTRHHLHFHAAPSVSGQISDSSSGSAMGNLVPIFYVDGNRMTDNMPLYQAIRSYSRDVRERTNQLLADHRFSMTEQKREDMINAFIWRSVHRIQYRLEKGNLVISPTSSDPLMGFLVPSGSSARGGSFMPPTSRSSAPVPSAPNSAFTGTSGLSAAISCLKRPRKPDEVPSAAAAAPAAASQLRSRLCTYLQALTGCHALQEGCMATNLALMRVLYGLSEFANTLDDHIEPYPIVPADHFQSQKLSAKASRQLQDGFSVLAGNLPNWLVQTISTCPFLFPFSVRQHFFYVHNFDRDRAVLHLQDSIANGSLDNETGGGGGGGNSNITLGSSGRRHANSVGGGSGPLLGHPPVLAYHHHHHHHHHHSHHRHSQRTGSGSSGSSVAVLENLLVESASQIQRHKITVNRDPKRLLRAAESALNELRDSRSILEIAFEGEVGFGLGPTLEFYTLVSHQLMTANLNLWHGHDFTSEGYVIAPAPGLYPRPLPKNIRSSQLKEIRAKFFFLGQLMARALLDWRQLDLSLSPTLFKWFLYTEVPEEDLVLGGSARAGVTPADVVLVDPALGKQLCDLQRLARRRRDLLDDAPSGAGKALEKDVIKIDSEIEDYCLTFVLPGYNIDLCRNGSQTAVTGDNLAEYLHLCANWFLVEGVKRQVTALLEGFDSVLPGVRTGKLATLFRADECEGLFCGSGSLGGLYRDQMALLHDSGRTPSSSSSLYVVAPTSPKDPTATTAAASGWDVDTLMKSCLCDHGYTHQSKAIQFLFEIMSEFDETRRRLFVQFTTGSPRLPIGGFRALKPPLKIVMKREAEEHADQHLPSVMTCQNYLKLPNYSTKEIMREKLLYAIHEGQHAFHLS